MIELHHFLQGDKAMGAAVA